MSRTLSVGDVLYGRPCTVTITKRFPGGPTIGYCEHCKRGHVINVEMYEAGQGPWKLVNRRPLEEVLAHAEKTSAHFASEDYGNKGEQRLADALRPFGWTCGPDFWERYYSDPWVFNLANAVERLTARLQEDS